MQTCIIRFFHIFFQRRSFNLLLICLIWPIYINLHVTFYHSYIYIYWLGFRATLITLDTRDEILPEETGRAEHSSQRGLFIGGIVSKYKKMNSNVWSNRYIITETRINLTNDDYLQIVRYNFRRPNNREHFSIYI